MHAPRWFPDELARAGEEHLDPDYVLAYDRKAGTDPAAEVALFRARGLNETSTLVDLGAGSGAFALAVAPHCRGVVAVDVSRPMLTLLRDRTDRLGIDNIECVQSGFLSYAHQGDLVDFVYSRNALHHLPDFWKGIALARIAAILKPGGILRLHDLVYSFDPRQAEEIFEAWLSAAPADPARGWPRPGLETHIREEYSTFNWLLEPMLERAGFAVEDVKHTDSRVFSAYTCTRTG